MTRPSAFRIALIGMSLTAVSFFGHTVNADPKRAASLNSKVTNVDQNGSSSLPSQIGSRRGGSDGGGGDAVLCYRDLHTKSLVREELIGASRSSLGVQSEVDLRLNQLEAAPTMLELYDSEQIGLLEPRQIQLRPEVGTSETKILAGIKEVDPSFYQYFKPFISAESQWQGKRFGIVEIDDSNSVARIGSNCILVQAAYYDDTANVIYYDTRIVSAMSQRDKVALKLHEDLYRMWRAYGDRAYRYFEGWQRNDLPAQRDILTRLSLNETTSDPIRPLVRYLVQQPQYARQEFARVSRNVVLDLVVKKNGWKSLYTLTNRYGNEELATRGNGGIWILPLK